MKDIMIGDMVVHVAPGDTVKFIHRGGGDFIVEFPPGKTPFDECVFSHTHPTGVCKAKEGKYAYEYLPMGGAMPGGPGTIYVP